MQQVGRRAAARPQHHGSEAALPPPRCCWLPGTAGRPARLQQGLARAAQERRRRQSAEALTVQLSAAVRHPAALPPVHRPPPAASTAVGLSGTVQGLARPSAASPGSIRRTPNRSGSDMSAMRPPITAQSAQSSGRVSGALPEASGECLAAGSRCRARWCCRQLLRGPAPSPCPSRGARR